MNKFKGTGIAIVTPFLADGSVDFSSLASLTNAWIAGGVEFLVILGTTGETATLTDQEQADIISTVSIAANGKIPLVLGVGGNDTAKVCAKAKEWVKKYQPDALLSVSPYYNRPSQEGIFQHFSALAESTSCPIILYNVPSRTGSNMTSMTTLRLARRYSHIIAVKEASGNFEQCMEIIRDKPKDFLVLSGDDAITLPLIGAGADGVISVVANALPRQFSDMVRLALAGNFIQAREAHYSMLRFTQLLFAEGNPVGVKAAMEILHLCKKGVRLPLITATEGLHDQLKKEMQNMHLA